MMRRSVLVSLFVAALVRSASADPQHEAEQLYRDGQAAFDQVRYDDALASWQRSYELSRASALLYNIGQAYRLRAHPGDCALARARYQDFVRLVEASPQRTLAEQYIAQLTDCATVISTVGASTETQVEASAQTSTLRHREIAVAAIGAGGIVLLGTGIYFGHHASTLGSEVMEACTVAHPCPWSSEKQTDAAGRRDATLGWTFDALGAAALLGSGALYYFGVRESEIHVAPIATRSTQTGVMLSWRKPW
jgi:tetratricopeptide (TPR) repeat protein